MFLRYAKHRNTIFYAMPYVEMLLSVFNLELFKEKAVPFQITLVKLCSFCNNREKAKHENAWPA